MKLIIFVDDERDVEFLFNYNFKNEIKDGKYELKYFSSAKSFLASEYANRIDQVDLVITDINMPEMDGFELTTEIKKLRSDLRVVLMTAYAFDSYHQIAIQAGADLLITKPIDFKNLKLVVEEKIGA